MIQHGARRAALAVILASWAVGLQAQQQWTFGSEIADLSWSHFDVAGGCAGSQGASSGLSVFGGRQVVAGLAVVATARIHYTRSPKDLSCTELPPRATEGTHVFELGLNPLMHTFVATDVRLEYQPQWRWFAPMAAAGGGSVFWDAAPTPYWLVAGGLGIRARPARVSLIVEYQRLGLRLDRTQATYNVDPTSGYPVLAAQTDLGSGRFWKSARLIALRFDFDVRAPR
jgi:hypothetical protein